MGGSLLQAAALVLLALASLAAVGLGAAVDSPPSLMSRPDYDNAGRGLDGALREALGRCREVAAASRGECRAEARAADRVRRAELVARYRGTVAARAGVQAARAKAGYDVARARCERGPAAQKPACVSEARAARDRALASAGGAAT